MGSIESARYTSGSKKPPRGTHMSAKHRSSAASDADLDSTAELPVLDVAASESVQQQTLDKLTSTDTWIIPPSAAVAVADTEIKALHAAHRELEERVAHKDRRIIEIETQLAESRAEHAANQVQVRTLTAEVETARRELGVSRDEQHLKQDLNSQLSSRDRSLILANEQIRQLQFQLAHYLERLQSSDGRFGVEQGELLRLSDAIEQRDARLQQSADRAIKYEQHIRDLTADILQRDERLTRAAQEVSQFAATLAQREQQLAQSQQQHAQLRIDVTELNEELLKARQQDVSRSVQSTDNSRMREENIALRDKLTAQENALRLANTQLSEQALATAALKAEYEQAERAAIETRTTLQAALDDIRNSSMNAAGELTGLRRQLEERTSALRVAIDERDARLQLAQSDIEAQHKHLQTVQERVHALEGQIADQIEKARAMQAQSRASAQNKQSLETELQAAQEAIARLETELKLRSESVDQLSKSSAEWRQLLEQNRESLAERDAFIKRLEDQAAHSASLLGSLQHSILSNDSNVAEKVVEAPPEGATRLLIRTDGDTEVLHVLSRKTTVGRTPDNDLQIDAKFISRHHAVILAGPNQTIIEDLNSTNGILVNNRRVTRSALKDGDNVTIGRTRFRFAARPSRVN
jgi:chromosome segregation ATPase